MNQFDSETDPTLREMMNSALLLASKTGNTELVSILLHHGANLHVRGANDETPLLLAAQHNHIDTIELLLEHEAKMNACDKDGNNMLHIACKHLLGDVVDSVLCRSTALLKDCNRNGDTPIAVAHNEEMMRFVLVRAIQLMGYKKHISFAPPQPPVSRTHASNASNGSNGSNGSKSSSSTPKTPNRPSRTQRNESAREERRSRSGAGDTRDSRRHGTGRNGTKSGANEQNDQNSNTFGKLSQNKHYCRKYAMKNPLLPLPSSLRDVMNSGENGGNASHTGHVASGINSHASASASASAGAGAVGKDGNNTQGSNANMSQLFWRAIGNGKGKDASFIFQNFDVYPFDRLQDSERIVVLTKVAEAMSGYKTDIECNILNESALFAVFAMIKKRIANELDAAQNLQLGNNKDMTSNENGETSSGSDTANDNCELWRKYTVAAIESVEFDTNFFF